MGQHCTLVENDVLAILRGSPGQPLSMRSILKRLGIPAIERKKVDVVLMSLMKRQLVKLTDPSAVIPEYCLANQKSEEAFGGFSGFDSPQTQEVSNSQFAGWRPLNECILRQDACTPLAGCDEDAEEMDRPSSPVFGLVENHAPLERRQDVPRSTEDMLASVSELVGEVAPIIDVKARQQDKRSRAIHGEQAELEMLAIRKNFIQLRQQGIHCRVCGGQSPGLDDLRNTASSTLQGCVRCLVPVSDFQAREVLLKFMRAIHPKATTIGSLADYLYLDKEQMSRIFIHSMHKNGVLEKIPVGRKKPPFWRLSAAYVEGS